MSRGLVRFFRSSGATPARKRPTGHDDTVSGHECALFCLEIHAEGGLVFKLQVTLWRNSMLKKEPHPNTLARAHLPTVLASKPDTWNTPSIFGVDFFVPCDSYSEHCNHHPAPSLPHQKCPAFRGHALQYILAPRGANSCFQLRGRCRHTNLASHPSGR